MFFWLFVCGLAGLLAWLCWFLSSSLSIVWAREVGESVKDSELRALAPTVDVQETTTNERLGLSLLLCNHQAPGHHG